MEIWGDLITFMKGELIPTNLRTATERRMFSPMSFCWSEHLDRVRVGVGVGVRVRDRVRVGVGVRVRVRVRVMARGRTAGSALSDCSCCSRVALTW